MTEPKLHELLMRRLEELDVPEDAGIGVAELHRRLIPYALCRESLGLATKAEYDIALLRLLADESRIREVEPALREAVRRELEAPEPTLGILHRFAAAEIRPAASSPSAATPEGPAPPPVGSEPVRSEPAPPPREPTRREPEARRPAAAAHETERRGTDRIPGRDDLELLPEPPGERAPPDPPEGGREAASGRCRACRSPLPARDGLRYCPRCGADQERWACPSCGAEVERGWRYCAMCGKLQPR